MPRGRSGTFKPTLLILLTGFFITAHLSARGSASAEIAAPQPKVPTHSWYVLQGADPRQVESPQALLGNRGLLPWTVATRGSAFAEIGARLYIAINGHGLIVTDPRNPLRGGYSVKEDPSVFQGRVLSSLFVREGKLYAHLYRNTLFDTPAPAEPSATLVHLDAESDEMWAQRVSLRFQDQNPEWEAVELLPSAKEAWKASWKKTAEKAEFKYVSFAYPGGPEQAVKRDHITNAYRFMDIREASDPLWNLYTEMVGRGANDVVYHIVVNYPGATEPRRYRAGSLSALSGGRNRLRTIYAYQSGNTTALLDPPYRIRLFTSELASVTIRLPHIPAGFVYTGIWYGFGTCVVSWEQRDFPDVGMAGFTVVDVEG